MRSLGFAKPESTAKLSRWKLWQSFLELMLTRTFGSTSTVTGLPYFPNSNAVPLLSDTLPISGSTKNYATQRLAAQLGAFTDAVHLIDGIPIPPSLF